MSRGGYLAIRIAVLLTGDSWSDLSGSALGSWVRIKATNELTEEPVSLRTAERLRVSADDLAELEAAGLLEEVDGLYQAVGMAAIKEPNKSDLPAAVAERMRRYRARQKEKAHTQEKEATPVLSSSVQVTEVTAGYGVTPVRKKKRTARPSVPPALDRSDHEESSDDPRTEGPESVEREESAPGVESTWCEDLRSHRLGGQHGSRDGRFYCGICGPRLDFREQSASLAAAQ